MCVRVHYVCSLSVYSSIFLSICSSVRLSVRPTIRLSTCPSFCKSDYLPIYLTMGDNASGIVGVYSKNLFQWTERLAWYIIEDTKYLF